MPGLAIVEEIGNRNYSCTNTSGAGGLFSRYVIRWCNTNACAMVRSNNLAPFSSKKAASSHSLQ